MDGSSSVQSERCIGRVQMRVEFDAQDVAPARPERGDLWVWGTRVAESAHEIRIEVLTPLRRRALHATRRDITRMLDALDLMDRCFPIEAAAAGEQPRV